MKVNVLSMGAQRADVVSEPTPVSSTETSGKAGSIGRLEELRQSGDRMRDERNWQAAAHFYGQALKLDQHDAAIWIQHGNMLKESGLFSKALESYNRAVSLQPSDPEPQVQLAIVSKFQGRVEAASAYFARSLELGYPASSFVRSEIEALRRSVIPSTRAVSDSDVTFYLSSVSMPVSETDPGQLKQFLGAAHYSYGYVLRGYHAALEAAGVKCQLIRNPEYFPDMRTISNGIAVHIGFYPPDGPRFLKGAHNIVCIAWEFERLRTRAEAKSYHAFSDAASMLSRAQEVWAISEFGAEAVRRSSNIDRVRAVPTPVLAARESARAGRPELVTVQKSALRLDRVTWVPLAVSPPMQPTLTRVAEASRSSLLNWLIDTISEEAPIFFLSVFNVHDYRKQMKPLIEAFVRFARDNPNVYLLLKVSCIDSEKLDINNMMFNEQIGDPGEMTPPLVSNRILMTTDALSRDEMNTLNKLASYYVCTSHAEGQNLPLIEAMASGVVPVSVDNTAMKDYITPDNAIVIPSHVAALTPRLTARYGMYGIGTHYVDGRSVYHALGHALALSTTEYQAKSKAAIATVAQRFGLGAFLENLRQSLDALGLDAASVAPGAGALA